VAYLLDALARTPDHITLKIVDGRIPDDGLVMRKLREHRLQRRVLLVRRMLTVEELVAEYSTARIALVPSFFEGFGFPASEAMACGLPVIATDGGALPEVVGTSGEAGRVVPFRDVPALAAAIAELGALPPETVAKMGAAARRRVQREFRWREAARRSADALAEVAHAHRRSR
jgi:glycosyltransferase involved in cell wall biosynthesis